MTANHPPRHETRTEAGEPLPAGGRHAGAMTTGTTPQVDWCVSVPGVAGMVRTVRHLVRAALAGSPRIDDIELIASELVTNAIRHTPSGDTGSAVTLRIRVSARWARIEVSDLGSASWAMPSSPPGEEERGRGLILVHALADEAGHRAVAGGHLSWAELSWTDRPTSQTTVPPAAEDDHRSRQDTHTGA